MKKTMHKAKTIAHEMSHARHKEDIMDIEDQVHPGEQNIKLKASNSHKGPYELENIQHVQEIKDEHEGPIWCMKFSCCGRLLATAGQDKVLRIWVVKDAFQFFQVSVFSSCYLYLEVYLCVLKTGFTDHVCLNYIGIQSDFIEIS